MDLLLDVVFVGVSVAFFTPTAPRLSWAAFAAVSHSSSAC